MRSPSDFCAAQRQHVARGGRSNGDVVLVERLPGHISCMRLQIAHLFGKLQARYAAPHPQANPNGAHLKDRKRARWPSTATSYCVHASANDTPAAAVVAKPAAALRLAHLHVVSPNKDQTHHSVQEACKHAAPVQDQIDVAHAAPHVSIWPAIATCSGCTT